jgi:plasmid replication initiation protein
MSAALRRLEKRSFEVLTSRRYPTANARRRNSFKVGLHGLRYGTAQLAINAALADLRLKGKNLLGSSGWAGELVVHPESLSASARA